MTVVLSINSGSSSLKVAMHIVCNGEAREVDRASGINLHEALLRLESPFGINVIAHRVVQGGPQLLSHVEIDKDILLSMKKAIPMAPLHLPKEISIIEQARLRFPGTPQVACFDTTFHQSMPSIAQRLPMPDWLWDKGLRHYGFHGLSYQHVVDNIGAADLGDAVVAHLGSGASTCAVRDGKSFDTSMGFTPGGGVMMGTRSGDVDPGLVSYLIRELGYDADSLFELFEQQSGLLGVSGQSSSMIALLDLSAAGDTRAAFAIEQFCYSVVKQIGAHAAALGGVKTIVFTGGVGVNAHAVTREIDSKLGYLSARVLIVPTDEEEVMARAAVQTISNRGTY